MNETMSKPLSDTMTPTQRVFNKVPQIAILFWIIKLLSTLIG